MLRAILLCFAYMRSSNERCDKLSAAYLAYERDHVDRPAAVDGNLTPFPINRYFPMPPAAEYAPDHKY